MRDELETLERGMIDEIIALAASLEFEESIGAGCY